MKEPHMPVAGPEQLRDRIDGFYVGLDGAFATLALTAPLEAEGLTDNPTLEHPLNPVVIGYENNGYIVKPAPVDEEYKAFFGGGDKEWTLNPDTNARGIPLITFVKLGDVQIEAEDLDANRATHIDEYLTGLIGSQGLSDVRARSRNLGAGEDDFIYRATHRGDRIGSGSAYLLNHLDPSANFESESMFNGDSSQVRLYVNDPDYSGDIVRVRIEEPAFYTRGGMGVARINPLFPHYVGSEQIEISHDRGSTWQKS